MDSAVAASTTPVDSNVELRAQNYGTKLSIFKEQFLTGTSVSHENLDAQITGPLLNQKLWGAAQQNVF